jgi:hypothetical protein
MELIGVAHREDPADPSVFEGEADHRVDGAVDDDARARGTVGAIRANPPSRLTSFFAPSTGCRTRLLGHRRPR